MHMGGNHLVRCELRNMTRRSASVFLTALFLSLLPISGQAQYGPQRNRAQHGMVASADSVASQVGVDILKAGGNAVDAAVAVGLALAVTYPAAGNLGGGGFMLIRLADGRTDVLDYREMAPAAAKRDMYLDASGNVVPNLSQVGYRAVGVPGTVAGLALAQKKYGKLTWKAVVAPARRLAEQGFPISNLLASGMRNNKSLPQFPDSRRIFQRDGSFYKEGEIFRQPDLARTLKRLEEKGPREFYEGETSALIVADMKQNGGLITADDLKQYKPAERTPLRGTYRGYEVLTMPPPSSGGIALIEMLNMLEGYDLKAMGDSSEAHHLMIEVMRRAFADRAQFLGDPDFVKVPAKGLTSKEYAKKTAATIDPNRATPSKDLRYGDPLPYESKETTHYSVVDAEGNAVSTTYTLNESFGSGVTAKGTGILLNNEMDDFTSKPGVPNGYGLVQGEGNAIAPRKRPLSSMTPTILTKDGKLFLVIGTPGGPTIITQVLQIIVHLLDHNRSLYDAIAAPRLHQQWLPDTVDAETFALSLDTRRALEAKGHTFSTTSVLGGRSYGNAQGILIEPNGTRVGASDPRGTGAAIGY
jgi:gamma-glutamyltranspeptidase/glutathione hydrolase